MSVEMLVNTDRPVVTVTADLATAWGRVKTNEHALRRSIHPAEEGARCYHEATEPLPALGLVTLRATEQIPKTAFDKAAASFNDADLWRNVRTEVTRGITWLQYAVATANSAASWAWPTNTYYMEPGVVLRLRSYAIPSGQSATSYIKWRFADSASGTVWFDLWWLRSLPTADDDAEGWYVSQGTGSDKVVSHAGSGIDVTPGSDIVLRVRVVRDHVIISGAGIGETWVTKLADGTVDPTKSGRVLCTVRGGMMLYHVQQMVYDLEGAVFEFPAAADYWEAPSHVVPVTTTAPEAEAVSYALRTGCTLSPVAIDSGTATCLSCGLNTTNRAISPHLQAIVETREPTLLAAASSETTIDGVVKAVVTLRREGRGQTCSLTFADPDNAATADFAENGVVTVAAEYDGTVGDPVTLFKGRVTDPRRWRRGAGGIAEDADIVLTDDAATIDAKRMLTMTGTWAGRTVEQAFDAILKACGIAAGRITTEAATGKLRQQDGQSLRFPPTESCLRALDVLAKAGGWVWGIEADGDFYAGPAATYGTARGTLEDGSITYLTYPHEVEYESTLVSGYANSVAIIGRTVDGRPTTGIYAPAPGVGQDLWDVREEEVDNVVAAAREVYDEVSRTRRFVAWAQNLDFAAMPVPWDTWTTGTLAGTNIDSGLTLRAEQVTYVVQSEPMHRAAVEIIASVEET